MNDILFEINDPSTYIYFYYLLPARILKDFIFATLVATKRQK